MSKEERKRGMFHGFKWQPFVAFVILWGYIFKFSLEGLALSAGMVVLLVASLVTVTLIRKGGPSFGEMFITGVCGITMFSGLGAVATGILLQKSFLLSEKFISSNAEQSSLLLVVGATFFLIALIASAKTSRSGATFR